MSCMNPETIIFCLAVLITASLFGEYPSVSFGLWKRLEERINSCRVAFDTTSKEEEKDVKFFEVDTRNVR